MKSSSMEQIRFKSRLTPLRITLIYFFVGAFWIFTSDKLLAIFVHNENTLLYLETFKGWFYVLVTAYMLYVLIQRSFATIERGQEALQKSMTELRERNKELNCLYSISKLVEIRLYSLEEILQGVTELLPPAWQYPEITCARIVLDRQEFKTENFRETRWRQACDLLIKEEPNGTLEVYYLEERPKADEGPFLKEERSLINTVAELLGKTIERTQAEIALQKSEKRFRDLVEDSLTGISMVQDNNVIYQNQEQERLLGPLPRSYLFGDFKGIHPEDVEKVKSKYQKIISGKSQRIRMDFRCYPSGRMDNKTDMKWVYCRAILTEYQGKESILFNLMDMTKAKELEQLLTIQDKMASLGRVAAGMAHEIRNPLSGVNIYLNTLEKIYDRPDSQPKVEQILSQLKSASRKIESIVRRVMDFSKPGEPKFALTNINKPVEEALNLTAVTLRKSGIKLQMSLAENLPLCKVDHNLIEEAVLNLINNAAQAMKPMEEGKLINVTSALEHNRIFVRISDSGPGVPKDIRNKILDPFFTTKSDGTGIGLSLCHRIIDDHGGLLTVSDSDLGGAEFRIELPQAQ